MYGRDVGTEYPLTMCNEGSGHLLIVGFRSPFLVFPSILLIRFLSNPNHVSLLLGLGFRLNI